MCSMHVLGNTVYKYFKKSFVTRRARHNNNNIIINLNMLVNYYKETDVSVAIRLLCSVKYDNNIYMLVSS